MAKRGIGSLNRWLLVAGAAIGYARWVRPWHLGWGTSPAERSAPLPGDGLVDRPRLEWTHAVTIRAPREVVWPWLVQIGWGRAGWYAYDFLDELAGAASFAEGGRSAERIVPELQDLKVGDEIRIMPDAGFVVQELQAPERMVLLVRADLDTGETFPADGPLPPRYVEGSWTWTLRELGPHRTRLIDRFRFDWNQGALADVAYRAVVEPFSFLMDRKMLLGIKRRAERR